MAAEHLWTLLMRCLTGTTQAESATLLAYSPYLRGDGTLAVLALHTALAADPRQRHRRPTARGPHRRCGTGKILAPGRPRRVRRSETRHRNR